MGDLRTKNATSFSKDHQPEKQGRTRIKEIRKLINVFGSSVAPPEFTNNKDVQHFLRVNGLRGTYNDAIIAKLYTMALRTTNLSDLTKAVDLIVKISSDNKKSEGNTGITINFISPPSIEQEKSIILENDSFSVVTPVDDSTPTP